MSVRSPRDPSEQDAHREPLTKSDPTHAGDLGFALPAPARVSATQAVAIGVTVLAMFGGAFVVAWVPKRSAQQDLAASTKSRESALLRIQVVTPKVTQSDRSMALPGSVQPLEETVVYPRSSGYVSRWLVDIGDKVAEGAALAEIDQPEIEQQLAQARAQLLQAQAGLVQASANRDYSKTTLDRYQKLTPSGVASQQELDKAQAQAQVDEANVQVAIAAIEAQQANVRRLSQMKSWGHVTAPFAGTVNSRTIERGALVSPTTPLFKISATDPVRVFVQVPQDVAIAVRSDVSAKVSVREYAGRVFEGKVARSAGSLDPTSRTMNTEVRVPNPKGELFAGMYATVALTLPSPHKVFELPATAVMNDSKGLRIAVVDAQSTLHLVAVVVERDTGATMEISSGVSEGDRVVKLSGTELVEGRHVEIAP